MSFLAARADSLARRVRHIADAEMRVAYVRHELLALSGREVADLVAIYATGQGGPGQTYRELMLTLSLALADPTCDALRTAAVQAAVERGQNEVVRLLGRESSARGSAPPSPDLGQGRPLTLGERKALARRNNRDLILRVLRDPHPDVVRIVLGNPCLTEDDVVRLCARRPIASEILREVFQCTRWIPRRRVQRTLVLNPNTPLDVALQLATQLTVQDARVVEESTELSDELRTACRDRRAAATMH